MCVSISLYLSTYLIYINECVLLIMYWYHDRPSHLKAVDMVSKVDLDFWIGGMTLQCSFLVTQNSGMGFNVSLWETFRFLKARSYMPPTW